VLLLGLFGFAFALRWLLGAALIQGSRAATGIHLLVTLYSRRSFLEIIAIGRIDGQVLQLIRIGLQIVQELIRPASDSK